MIAQWLHILGLPSDRHDKPRVGVSACLLGDAVRYDGEHKRDALISDSLSPCFDVVRLCPEVAIGLPVPRPPIQVVALESGHRVRRVDDATRDVTDALRAHAMTQDTLMDGFILKARSPSCGVGTTPVHNAAGEEMHTRGNGAFADALLSRGLAAPVVNESHLQSLTDQQVFLLQTHLHRALREKMHVSRRSWLDGCTQLPDSIGSRLAAWINHLADTGDSLPMLQSAQADCGEP